MSAAASSPRFHQHAPTQSWPCRHLQPPAIPHRFCSLSPQEAVHQPQHEAEHNAKNDAGRDGEEHGSVFSSVADVAWQASERHVGAPGQQNDRSDQNQQSASANEQLT